MEVNIRSGEVADVVEASGRIGANESRELMRRLEAHLANGAVRALVLDLGDADYISSAGLGTVIWLGKRMREEKQGFALAGLRDRVAHVFKLSGLDRIMPVYEHLSDAEAAIERGESGGAATASGGS